MLSQQNLIYLGIALLIVVIAFFAYQELQKHHTEIEKLRMQSQKLEKIIYAYNMRQWHQSNDPYLGQDESEDDESEDEDESSDESNDDNMSTFIRHTLNSIGTPSGPSKVTISTNGRTVQFPVTPQPNEEDEIPEVDTFDMLEKKNSSNKLSADRGRGESGNENDEILEEMEQNDFDINEVRGGEDENVEGGGEGGSDGVGEGGEREREGVCQVPIRTGDRKGEVCGNAAKAKGMCLRHFRQENKISG